MLIYPPKVIIFPQNVPFFPRIDHLTTFLYRIFALLLAKFAKVPGLGGGGQLAGTGKRQQAQELKEKKKTPVMFLFKKHSSSPIHKFKC